MLRKGSFPSQAVALCVRCDDAEVGGKVSKRRARAMAKKSGKVWSMEEVQSGVEAAVRKVVSIEDSQEIDHQISLMDMGLDSLGTTELSQSLQSYFDVELPSTFVFNNPTVADMSNHLFGLLGSETDDVNDEALVKANSRPLTELELSIVGMSCRFPGGVTSLVVSGSSFRLDSKPHRTSHLIGGTFLASLQGRISAKRKSCKSHMDHLYKTWSSLIPLSSAFQRQRQSQCRHCSVCCWNVRIWHCWMQDMQQMK